MQNILGGGETLAVLFGRWYAIDSMNLTIERPTHNTISSWNGDSFDLMDTKIQISMQTRCVHSGPPTPRPGNVCWLYGQSGHVTLIDVAVRNISFEYTSEDVTRMNVDIEALDYEVSYE